MDTSTTVEDFLRDPDVLGNEDPLTDRELERLGILAPCADPLMSLGDLVERIKTGQGWW